MSREYQCINGCGRRQWIEEVLLQEHTCLVCHGLLRATGRFTAPSLVERMIEEEKLSERSAKHQTHVVLHAYTLRIETTLKAIIENGGTILDKLDKSA